MKTVSVFRLFFIFNVTGLLGSMVPPPLQSIAPSLCAAVKTTGPVWTVGGTARSHDNVYIINFDLVFIRTK
jgi:hypothetical protein